MKPVQKSDTPFQISNMIDEQIIEIKIDYNTFLNFKAVKYKSKIIKTQTAKFLKIHTEAIDDLDFNYKRTYKVYLDGNLKDLQKNYKMLKEENHYKKIEKGINK